MVEQVQTHKYDIFISYAREDYEWVEGYLLDALGRAQIAYHTEEAFELGRPRLLAFEDAIQQSKRILLVLSPAYLMEGHTLFVDLLAQFYGLETSTWPVIPLILKPIEKLPPRLGMLVSLNAVEEKDWEPALKRLAEVFQQPVAPPTPVPEAPYPGMRSFTEKESDHFFGRNREIEDLVQLLRGQHLLALIGPSGSGKSSLVHAGLIPELHKSTLFGPGTWLVRDFRPGENPLAALTSALAGDPSDPGVTIPALLATSPDVQRLLIFVDQFEEMFTVTTANTSDFQNILVELAKTPNTHVVIGVRADFYPELMTSPIWRVIPPHCRYEVLPLNEKGLSEAIVRPAERVGVYIESALVERIVADAGREPGILPFIQETMRLLWDRVERRYLRVEAYETLVLPRSAYGGRRMEEVTGLQAAIAMHAEAVFTKLEGSQQAIAQRIFVRLGQFGEGRSHTRRQQPVSRLRGNFKPALFEQVLAYLADEKSRLLILGGEEKGSEREVDIAHEALIGAWPRLLDWLEKQRAGEQFRRGFVQDVDQWVGKHGDAFFLYEGTKLEEALGWETKHDEELSSEEREFLQASIKHDRQRKFVRMFVRSVIVLFALFGIFAVGYFARLAYLNYSARGSMAYFPAGPALLGPDLSNLRTVEISSTFSLDKHEVTNRQYQLCMQAGRCWRPNEPAYYAGINAVGSENLPVVWVSGYQAAAFCDSLGERLPTQVEWERAVRGKDGRPWPWGKNAPTSSRVNIFLPDSPEAMQPFIGLAPIDDPRFASGATEEGITHLLGNAAEWTSTPGSCLEPYGCSMIWDGATEIQSLNVVGLSWADDLLQGDTQRVTEALPAQPIHFSDAIGFRCARSL